MVGLSLTLEDVVCRFGDMHALDGISLSIAAGEFLVVLGPSGCGKTTLLRALAGFHRPQSGRVRIGEQIVACDDRFVPPEERNVGIVFQSYALWPHMSVAGNVGFALERRSTNRAGRQLAIDQALRQVGLDQYGQRRPGELSGGQRQRVALARCLAKSAGVVLLDEPLANLDPTLRSTVQNEFVTMHARIRSTFVYVTHDQQEALALADRVALMAHGRILQCDAPRSIYERPASAEVARFLGNSRLLPATVIGRAADGTVRVDVAGTAWQVRAADGQSTAPVLLSVRPHDLALESLQQPGALAATVLHARYQGSHWLVRVALRDSAAPELDIAHRGEPPDRGKSVGVRILDGWVLPHPPP